MSEPDPYWLECVECALDEAGLTATPEQMRDIAQTVERGVEGKDAGSWPIANPDREEIDRLKRELSVERRKVGCRACGGSGRLRFNAGSWAADQHCDDCHGSGKVAG